MASLPRERRGAVAASALDWDSSPSSKSLSLCSSEMNCSATTTQVLCVCQDVCVCVWLLVQGVVWRTSTCPMASLFGGDDDDKLGLSKRGVGKVASGKAACG